MSDFEKGFSNGVLLRGVPVEQPTGKTFWCNNSGVLPEGAKGASNNNKGGKHDPFSTLTYALSQCVAGRGDTIYLAPGHTETLTANVDIDVDAVTIMGLGTGSDMARFDYTDAAGELTVTADNVTLENLNFHANVTSVAYCIDCTSTATQALTIRDCLFDVESSGTDEFNLGVHLRASNDDYLIEDCVFDMGLGGATVAILMGNASDGLTVRRNRMVGDYSSACIANTNAASTNLSIEDNLLFNGKSGNVNAQPVIDVQAAATGWVRRNTMFCNLATIAAMAENADTMLFFDNWAGEDMGAAAGNIRRTDATSVTASADG